MKLTRLGRRSAFLFCQRGWFPGIVLVVALILLAPATLCKAAEDAVSFKQDVAPILLKQCQSCHGPQKSKGRYRLDSFQRLMQPGKSKSAAITPGDPAHSEMYRLISSSDEDERMPQKADALPPAQVRTIQRWIEQGAKFDGPDPTAPLASVAASADDNVEPPAVYPRPVPITAIAFSPDGKELAASGYHEITLWDPADGKLLGRIKGLPERIWSLAYSPDGKQIAAAGGTPGLTGEVRLCDATSRVPGKVIERISDMMLVIRFSPDGKRLGAGGADNAVRVFDVESGKRQLLIEQHADWVTDLAFSPDGTKLVTASRDKSARVFDATTGEMLAAHLAHAEPIFGVAWSDDGTRVYSVGRDRAMHVWTAADGKPASLGEEKPAKGKSKASGLVPLCDVDTFKVVTGEGMVFTASADGFVRKFSQVKRSDPRKFPAASDWVYCLAMDERSARIAAGCHDGTIRMYDAETGGLISHFIAAPNHPLEETSRPR
jgi:mono/diheme cytochrome c family protein